MPKTAVISARIDPHLKSKAERVFRELGLSTTQAITLFYREVNLQHGLPFQVKIPNRATRQALRAAQKRRNLASFENANDLFQDLGI
jgi:DNA-damage-inducible protein J